MSTFDDLGFAEVDVEPVLAVQLPGHSAMDPSTIAGAIGAGFGKLAAYLNEKKLTPAGPPRTIYTSYGDEEITFVLAFPILAPPAETAGDKGPASIGPLGGTKAMRITHKGPYANLMITYGRITEFLKARGLLESEADWAKYMPMWEEYLNNPASTPEAELLTHIYLPTS